MVTQEQADRTTDVLADVVAERIRQEARYGPANDLLKDGTGPDVRWLAPYTHHGAKEIEVDLRWDYEAYGANNDNDVTWMHLVREEIAESFQESDPDRLEAELIQVAALAVSWVERLRARKAVKTSGS